MDRQGANSCPDFTVVGEMKEKDSKASSATFREEVFYILIKNDFLNMKLKKI